MSDFVCPAQCNVCVCVCVCVCARACACVLACVKRDLMKNKSLILLAYNTHIDIGPDKEKTYQHKIV